MSQVHPPSPPTATGHASVHGAAGARLSPLLACEAAWWLVLLVIPWLNPWAQGPSASVQPWLVSALCAFLLVLSHGRLHVPRGILAVLGGLCLLGALHHASTLDVAALAGAGLVILASACAAAGQAQRPEFVRIVALAWVAAAMASCVIALCQYFGVTSFFEPWMSSAALGEAFANLRQRNQFASLTSIGLAALIWLAAKGLSRERAWLAIALLAAGNAASASRTGVVQWLLVMALGVATSPHRRQTLVLCGIGMGTYVASALALPQLLQWATGTAGPSVFMRFVGSAGCSSRAVLWSNVVDLIAARPWFGWGWGRLDYAHYMTLYRGDRFCDILDNAHNLPLHLAVEAGLPVAVIVSIALGWVMWRSAPLPGRDRAPDREMAWAVLAVILVHSLLEYPLWYGPFQMAFGLGIGLLWPAATPARAAAPARIAPGLTRVLLAVPALVAIAYASWDYRRISQIYLPPEARAAAYADDTLGKLHASWLFRKYVLFAELTIKPLTRANAQWIHDTATSLLDYSPEPRVIEKVIDSALALGREDEAVAHLRRFQAAFPKEYAAWRAANGLGPGAQRDFRS